MVPSNPALMQAARTNENAALASHCIAAGKDLRLSTLRLGIRASKRHEASMHACVGQQCREDVASPLAALQLTIVDSCSGDYIYVNLVLRVETYVLHLSVSRQPIHAAHAEETKRPTREAGPTVPASQPSW